MWGKKCSTENFDTSYLPTLSINFFATGFFLKHCWEKFPNDVFRHCETKVFEQKIMIPFCIINRNQLWNWYLQKLFHNKIQNSSFVFNRLHKLIKVFVVGRKIWSGRRPSCYFFLDSILGPFDKMVFSFQNSYFSPPMRMVSNPLKFVENLEKKAVFFSNFWTLHLYYKIDFHIKKSTVFTKNPPSVTV